MEDIIVVKNLYHNYKTGEDKSVEALSDISLNIKKGEFVAIVGTNGSGKSTLAKHFNALLFPSQGSCIICGLNSMDEKNVLAIRQNVGMVFQNPDNQLVAAVVEEDVAFGPENIGMEPNLIRERVDFALAVVNMSDYREQAPHMLSGGQKQRVAIAGVLALQPSCMVLDEPTAMLDPVGRKEVLNTIKMLNQEKGITIVYITHFMQEAAMADKVVVMSEGKIVLTGKPNEVFTQVEKMKELGLETPLAADVAWQLKNKGFALPFVTNDEELAIALCR